MNNLIKIGCYLIGIPLGCLITFVAIGLSWELINELEENFKRKDFLSIIGIILIIMITIGSILLVVGEGLR